jgi:hypothetical protein
VVPYPVAGNFTPFAYASLSLKDGPATVMQNVVEGQLGASRLRFYAEAFGDFVHFGAFELPTIETAKRFNFR